MDHRDVHHIIKKLTNKLTCPHCNTKIRAKFMKVVNVLENDCAFVVVCPSCKSQMVLAAHLETEVNEKFITSNTSTRILLSKCNRRIQYDDVQNIKNYLQDFKSDFKGFFKND